MIKLTCNSCGGKLEITDDIERFACGHCGTEWLVNRGGGIVSLKSVENKLEKISSSSEKTAEHSKIVADEIRLKKIKEKISALEEEKSEISLEPLKGNTEKWKNHKYANYLCLSILIISLMIGFISRANTVGRGVAELGTVLSVLSFFIIQFIFSFIPETLLNEEKKKINLQKFAEIKREILNFKDKAKEIEESFFK